MDSREITLVQNSFRRILPSADRTAALFFARLFEIDPALRHQLTGDHSTAGRKLMQALSLAINGLHCPAMLSPLVRRIGMRGAGALLGNGRPEAVGAALLWALEKSSGQPFPLETRNAWNRAYWFLAGSLKAGARDAVRATPLAA
jgi:hemoglobin-like flavoprotein